MKNVSASWYNFGLLLGIGLNELKTWDANHRDAAICWNEVSNVLSGVLNLFVDY